VGAADYTLFRLAVETMHHILLSFQPICPWHHKNRIAQSLALDYKPKHLKPLIKIAKP